MLHYTQAHLGCRKGNLKEGIAKLAAWAKFDDFFVSSVFRKVTYLIGHRHFAKNLNPTKKARIWPTQLVLQFPQKLEG